MTSHRQEDAPDTSSPAYALAEVYRIAASVGLIGWVVIVYVASEVLDWSAAQIVGFAIGLALVTVTVGVALRVAIFALSSNRS